jgi:hypothetical protein
MLDVDSPLLFVLIIEGALYFDTTVDLSLDSHYIFVHGGQLQVAAYRRSKIH